MPNFEAVLFLASMIPIEDFDMDDEPLIRNIVPRDAVDPRGTLSGLIDAPTANVDVLKSIYRNFFRNMDRGGVDNFLERWHNLYFWEKKPLFDEFTYRRLDIVANTQGCDENYCKPKGSEEMGEQKIQLLIEDLHLQYKNSNYLHNAALEKLITLVIIKKYIPYPFFGVFNYACSLSNTEFKESLLRSLYEMELVGYNKDRDRLLLDENF
ncbi:hypothetical protein CAEBREN_18458 [Caenorhabditis brenneri]|uniref:Uncharacterized protein n=1 Tax=Caenorhabditis brenneri TaxID=135651 RepID=G0MST1_CAEBE|nr:hypothetical protein CAEBREN_18458 [Caenorhabditis brenneri]